MAGLWIEERGRRRILGREHHHVEQRTGQHHRVGRWTRQQPGDAARHACRHRSSTTGTGAGAALRGPGCLSFGGYRRPGDIHRHPCQHRSRKLHRGLQRRHHVRRSGTGIRQKRPRLHRSQCQYRAISRHRIGDQHDSQLHRGRRQLPQTGADRQLGTRESGGHQRDLERNPEFHDGSEIRIRQKRGRPLPR